MGDSNLLKEIYDKNIVFLFGSGASYGALPTLATKISDESKNKELTMEEIVTELESKHKADIKKLFFFEVIYKQLIEPSIRIEFNDVVLEDKAKEVLENYTRFIEIIIEILNKKKINDYKRCNIFTTNYDGFFENAAERLINKNSDFIFNDGTKGFRNKVLNISNYNLQTYSEGITGIYKKQIPNINLIKMHGSIFNIKHEKDILVNYHLDEWDLFTKSLSKEYINATCDTIDKLENIIIKKSDKDLLEEFWIYFTQDIHVVNPTKKKFHETVFEQHYYQMLRLLSYEIEKNNTILMVFGFSFNDEHIYEIVKRSLTNPNLHMHIFCLDTRKLDSYKLKFRGFNNVSYIIPKKKTSIIDFSGFNKIISNDNRFKDWRIVR